MTCMPSSRWEILSFPDLAALMRWYIPIAATAMNRLMAMILKVNSPFIASFFRWRIVESRKGVSPLRSHGTVRESLPSYGSSCLITNVFLHFGYTNSLAVISSHSNQSSQCLLVVKNYKTKQAKSFDPLSFNNFITTTT